jgi:hypothetical protein
VVCVKTPRENFRQISSTTWLEGVGAKFVWSVMQVVRLRWCFDVDVYLAKGDNERFKASKVGAFSKIILTPSTMSIVEARV